MGIKPLKSLKFPGLPDTYTVDPGLSEEAKAALLACFQHVAWIDEHGQYYYDALERALNGTVSDYPKIIVRYTEAGHVINANDSLESIRPYLTVIYYETEESSGTTVSDYTLLTLSPIIPGTNTVVIQYNGLQSVITITVNNPIYEYLAPENHTYNSTYGKWADRTHIEGLYESADGYNPVKRLSVSGIADHPTEFYFSYVACPQEKTGRATSNTQIIVGNFDGKKIGLRRYLLSNNVSISFNVFYGLINDDNRTFSGYLVTTINPKDFGGWTFYNSEQILPSSQSPNLRFVEVSFKKGDSSVDFTDSEIAELAGLLYIE